MPPQPEASRATQHTQAAMHACCTEQREGTVRLGAHQLRNDSVEHRGAHPQVRRITCELGELDSRAEQHALVVGPRGGTARLAHRAVHR
eukprot:scaffold25384_cov129-Isochrysis_galbana.AAC.8